MRVANLKKVVIDKTALERLATLKKKPLLNMGLLAIAIAPGIAICLFIYLKDKYNKEPFGLMIVSFIMGMLAIIPAVIIQIALTKPVEHIMGEGG